MPNAKSRATAGANTKTASQLRIIGGRFRGRKLNFPEVDGLRPTGDRIRETLFNWLAPEIVGANCLDLFSGSGALGLECISRGAELTTLIERDHRAFATLKGNIALLKIDSADLILGDSLAHLARPATRQYDVVFIDPPFSADLWQRSVELLETHGWLAEQASIYVELPRTQAFCAPANWHLHRDKGTGAVSYRLYYRNHDSRDHDSDSASV